MCLCCRDLLIRLHHKLMRTRTYVKLHFRCFFSCRQVGSIYLMQGEFAESIFFLIPRSWSGAWPSFDYVDKKGVKWTKSDFSLLLCIPGQNCKLDFRFSLSKNYRSFDYLSKHISSELTMCLSYHTSISVCSASCTKLIHTRKDSYMAVNAH